MTKRSPGRERRERDFYPTPLCAVGPLIPHLNGIRRFAEPCDGEGDLVRHLESHGLVCVYRGDIATGQDALLASSFGPPGTPIVTNPPWSREVLHPMITHFARIAPTWLLLDADWAHTRQAAPYLSACSDIVSVGRLRWIPGTKHNGFDNCSWYRFDTRHVAGPVFHGRDSGGVIRRRACDSCGRAYVPVRATSRFCSGACRMRACRGRLSVTLASQDDAGYDSAADVEGSFNEAYRAIRERIAAGGPPWVPKPADEGAS
jgi:hypothetical protein